MKVNEFLKEKGIIVHPTKELALKKNDALKYIQLLRNEGKIILGGDVYLLDPEINELIPTCDSWYLDDDEINVKRGYEISNKYIKQYMKDSKNIDSVYFVIVSKA